MKRIMDSSGIMSAIAFFITIGVFLIANVLLVSNTRVRDLTSENLIADRVYYIQDSIERSVVDIIEKVLGNETGQTAMNVTIDESSGSYIYVTFSENFPKDATGFKTQLDAYENFVESYLNETNIVVDTTIADIGNTMTIEVEPYEITYTHSGTWGDGSSRTFNVTAQDSPQSAGNINGYNIVVQLADEWDVMPENASWEELSLGDIETNITLISYDGLPTYTTTQYLDRQTRSMFTITANTSQGGYQEGPIDIVISEFAPASVYFEMGLCEALVKTTLNLTETEGTTLANLPEGKINVVETLYYIEKNSTVRLQ